MASGTALAVTLLLIVPSGQTAPSVSAPPEVIVATGDLAAVRVTWEGDAVRWQASPGLNAFREYDEAKNVIALRVMAQKAGEYTLTFVACKGGTLTDFVTTRVKVGHAPQPPPDEPEVPTAPGALTVLVIEDTTHARTPAVARVLTDKAMWDEIKSRGNVWRILPRDSPLTQQKGYGQLADAVGCPALILIDSTGRPVNTRKLPASSAELLNVVKEYQR